MAMHFKKSSRFQSSIAAFDALNGQDPHTLEVDEQSVPKELHHALSMTAWIESLYPEASEAVYLAARCQHLCRWELPRSSYPEGRVGYLKWRSELKKRHAEQSEKVLREQTYDSEMIDAVAAINLKQGLKSNPDVQQIEDALCLVFLEKQLEGYLGKWEDAKIIRILKKTWGKMSERGQEAALDLPMSAQARALVELALS